MRPSRTLGFFAILTLAITVGAGAGVATTSRLQSPSDQAEPEPQMLGPEVVLSRGELPPGDAFVSSYELVGRRSNHGLCLDVRMYGDDASNPVRGAGGCGYPPPEVESASLGVVCLGSDGALLFGPAPVEANAVLVAVSGSQPREVSVLRADDLVEPVWLLEFTGACPESDSVVVSTPDAG